MRSLATKRVTPMAFELRHIYNPLVRRMLEQADQQHMAPQVFFEDAARDVKLLQGDSMTVMAQIPAESIDLVFADPPYFLSSGGITCQNQQVANVNKGEWDKPIGVEAMYEYNSRWLQEAQRILKSNGSIWVSGTMHNIYSVGFALQKLGFDVLNDIAWHKIDPPPNISCRFFTHATETIIWARKEPKARHTFRYEEMKQENGGKQMPSLWHIRPPRPSEKRHGKHPTQKPEALLTRIIQASSQPGDLVLDPFSGSGTTGVICARLGRRFIGIEREAEYNAIAGHRIQDELARLAP